jgi:hypothetical protein
MSVEVWIISRGSVGRFGQKVLQLIDSEDMQVSRVRPISWLPSLPAVAPKYVPRKNARLLTSEPFAARPIEQAARAQHVACTIASTDDIIGASAK